MKEIKAKEGFYLTQASEVPTEERMFITAIKGANVNVNDWREAKQEEKDAWDKMMEEKSAENEISKS